MSEWEDKTKKQIEANVALLFRDSRTPRRDTIPHAIFEPEKKAFYDPFQDELKRANKEPDFKRTIPQGFERKNLAFDDKAKINPSIESELVKALRGEPTNLTIEEEKLLEKIHSLSNAYLNFQEASQYPDIFYLFGSNTNNSTSFSLSSISMSGYEGPKWTRFSKANTDLLSFFTKDPIAYQVMLWDQNIKIAQYVSTIGEFSGQKINFDEATLIFQRGKFYLTQGKTTKEIKDGAFEDLGKYFLQLDDRRQNL